MDIATHLRGVARRQGRARASRTPRRRGRLMSCDPETTAAVRASSATPPTVLLSPPAPAPQKCKETKRNSKHKIKARRNATQKKRKPETQLTTSNLPHSHLRARHRSNRGVVHRASSDGDGVTPCSEPVVRPTRRRVIGGASEVVLSVRECGVKVCGAAKIKRRNLDERFPHLPVPPYPACNVPDLLCGANMRNHGKKMGWSNMHSRCLRRGLWLNAGDFEWRKYAS
ncbi:hypothetical protein C8R45DRAFT_929602 [Mycena sanguinolenta]|nr:hypothetical protein C8R45DRAFT_929602 [Mycena sanguinolenta]